MTGLFNFAINIGSTNVQKNLIPTPSSMYDKIELSFNRDASKNFWLTFDADNNRNIGRYSQSYVQSMTYFLLKPVIFSTYAIAFHGADVIAYNGHLDDWVTLEDKVQTGFPGPSVRESLKTLQQTYPPFNNFRLKNNESKILTIPKIGVFSASLSSEFTIKLLLRENSYGEDYVGLGVLLHVNSRYLVCTCLVPNMSPWSEAPAYFLGCPEILDNHDTKHLKKISDLRLIEWSNLADGEKLRALHERILIQGKIT